MINAGVFRYSLAAFFGLLLSIFMVDSAFAQDQTISDLAENVVDSSTLIPGLITGLSYLFALLLGVTGILKLKDHVENPAQTPIRVGIIRLLAGGALLALPIVYDAMATAIDGGGDVDFDPGTFTVGGFLSGILGTISGALGGITTDFNGILAVIINSIEDVPGIITAAAYLFGLVLGVIGILKIKDHVENPDQTPLREGVIRLIIGGALFSITAVYQAMFEAFDGDVGFLGQVASVFSSLDVFVSDYETLGNFCNPVGGILGSSLRDSLCGIVLHAGAFPAFLAAISYLIGLILGFWGILKIKDHVLNPTQTQVWEGVSRLLAGGMFFALPVIIEVVRQTVAPLSSSIISSPLGSVVGNIFGIGGTITSYNETAATCTGNNGLDGALYCMMSDVLGPMHVVLNFFTFSAGMVLIMIGISRLIKSAQEGARGPGGFGTIMTFAAGGALISYNEFMRMFTMSFFTNPTTLTFAKLAYDTGLDPDELAHAHTVISAILKFMIIIGLISFVRGIFIIRNVAEGNQQASLMAGITHMVGGALAVNLGPLINAVQTTLGITGYGIGFT